MSMPETPRWERSDDLNPYAATLCNHDERALSTRLREKAAVESSRDVLGADALATEPTSVQALHGILATLLVVELDVDGTIRRVRVNGNVDNGAVLILTFGTNLAFEFFGELLATLGSEEEMSG